MIVAFTVKTVEHYLYLFNFDIKSFLSPSRHLFSLYLFRFLSLLNLESKLGQRKSYVVSYLCSLSSQY